MPTAPTCVPLAAEHLQRKYPDTSCWLLLVDVRDVPLCYVHWLITSLGISPYAINNGGQYMDTMPQATNILVQFNSQHVLDRLAERWYPDEATNYVNNGATVMAQRSPRVTKVAVGRIQTPLVRTMPLPSTKMRLMARSIRIMMSILIRCQCWRATQHTRHQPIHPPRAFLSVVTHHTTSPKRESMDTSARTGKIPRTDRMKDWTGYRGGWACC